MAKYDNKTTKVNDNIYTFLKSSLNESTNFGGGGGRFIGFIDIKKNDSSPVLYTIKSKFNTSSNKYDVTFSKNDTSNYDYDNFNIESINDLYTKKYKEEVSDKNIVENMPDEYFEIRKIQRQQTDF